MQKSFKYFKYFIVLFLISAAIVVFSSFGFFNPVKGVLGRVFSPVVSFFDSVSQKFRGAGQSISDVETLQKENEELKKQVEELVLETAALKGLKTENESLKKQLNFTESIPQKTIAASVIRRNNSEFSKTITIDRGSESGIKKGMAVTTNSFMIGKVYETTSHTAIILLLTDSNFEVSGFIQESRALGLIKGQIGSGLIMDMIPQDKEVSQGDTVITSNIEENIPEGLVLGKVFNINREDQGLFQKASIIPFAKLDEMKHVIIVLGR